MGMGRPGYAVVTVAGTNGKGSTVAMIEGMLCAAGYKVGAYTSPHLVRYNERICVQGQAVSDLALIDSFERIDAARGATPLTYFEFGTIAAFDLFRSAAIDVAVLEVGMGGRLDAVNVVDADVGVVCAIGIDHVAWLGPDRETIGREKAGILRPGRPAVCSDPDPPMSIRRHAEKIKAELLQLGRDFFIERGDAGWTWRSGDRIRTGLPYPALRGEFQLNNAAGALMALECLGERFPVTQGHIRDGLHHAAPPGRFQVLPGSPRRVLDVAHNAQAARALAATLKRQPVVGRTLAVFGMLVDKVIPDVARAMAGGVERWYVAPLPSPRSATTEQLLQALTAGGVTAPVTAFADVRAAYEAAGCDARPDDRIVVFGSFYAVGDILSTLKSRPSP